MNSNKGRGPDTAHTIGDPDEHVKKGRNITQEVPQVTGSDLAEAGSPRVEANEVNLEALTDKELARMLKGALGMAESFINQLRIRLNESPSDEWRKRVIGLLRGTRLPVDAEE
ncbi:hypothetical protein HY477_02895 [Candidatus Uhrbacteria bacterium]|nr:hypothetical protein [Candidatus Uhrbacteria bacterium]